MATVSKLLVREWLNEDEGSAYVYINAEKEDDYKYIGCSLEIKDCNKQITLDFDYSNEEQREERLGKIVRLISHLESIRTFIENNPNPTKEEIEAVKAKEKEEKE